jgi:redox-sensitive bicupin YhaK (pirin superfamily)
MMDSGDHAVVRKRSADARGFSDLGWLSSRHTFSFGEYQDPAFMGFGSLRVINEDVVAPGKGFGTHPHRDMEILSYVLEGELKHEDSLGNGRVIQAGEFQYMSAGSGILHSEFNPSTDKPVHFLQIWIEPKHTGGEPRYKDFDTAQRRQHNGLLLLASADGREDSARIRQDAEVYFGALQAAKSLNVEPSETFGNQWVQVLRGEVSIAGTLLRSGDGASIEGNSICVEALKDAEFLLFRLT